METSWNKYKGEPTPLHPFVISRDFVVPVSAQTIQGSNHSFPGSRDQRVVLQKHSTPNSKK